MKLKSDVEPSLTLEDMKYDELYVVVVDGGYNGALMKRYCVNGVDIWVDLSGPNPEGLNYWDSPNNTKVKLVPKGSEIVV